MDRIFNISELEVVGFMEVPITGPAMPRLLSAIFAVSNSQTVLLPPYTLGELEVIGPVLSNREEFQDLVACEEVSAIKAVPAQSSHELWLDDQANIYYTPDHETRGKLLKIFETRCGLARQALKSGAWLEARAHAMVASSANPRSLDPLLLRATAEQLMASSHADPEQNRAELALTEMVAKSYISIPDFRALYLQLVEEYSSKSSRDPIEWIMRLPASKN